MRLQLTVIALSCLGATASAQEALRPQPGERIRVTVPNSSPAVRIGRLESLSGTDLRLYIGSSSLTIPFITVRRMEVSRGRRPNFPLGAAGFLVGGAAGGVAGCLANKDSYGVFCAGQNDTKVFGGAALGGLVGAAAGAFLFRRERWATLDLAILRR